LDPQRPDAGSTNPDAVFGAHVPPTIAAPPPPSLGPKLRKRRRGVAILPSLFTLGNCLAGFASINYAARGGNLSGPEAGATLLGSNYAVAGYFIFLAMLFDMFDGFVARLTRSASDFGAELDSLADMVSFGLAPAFLSLSLIGSLMGATNASGKEFLALPGPFSDDAWRRLFWVIAAIYVSCTALRLARFNVINKHDVGSHMSFRGMPSPGAAAVVAATVIFFESLLLPADRHRIPFNVSDPVKEWLTTVFPYLLPVVLLTAALLMVSRFAYTHLINRFLRGRRKFRNLVAIFLVGMLVVWQPQISAIVAIYLYAVSAPLGWLLRTMTGRKAVPASLPPPPHPPAAT
jgi:CDP-diacylglycerol--serine O-phosphatidyltransferase